MKTQSISKIQITDEPKFVFYKETDNRLWLRMHAANRIKLLDSANVIAFYLVIRYPPSDILLENLSTYLKSTTVLKFLSIEIDYTKNLSKTFQKNSEIKYLRKLILNGVKSNYSILHIDMKVTSKGYLSDPDISYNMSQFLKRNDDSFNKKCVAFENDIPNIQVFRKYSDVSDFCSSLDRVISLLSNTQYKRLKYCLNTIKNLDKHISNESDFNILNHRVVNPRYYFSLLFGNQTEQFGRNEIMPLPPEILYKIADICIHNNINPFNEHMKRAKREQERKHMYNEDADINSFTSSLRFNAPTLYKYLANINSCIDSFCLKIATSPRYSIETKVVALSLFFVTNIVIMCSLTSIILNKVFDSYSQDRSLC